MTMSRGGLKGYLEGQRITWNAGEVVFRREYLNVIKSIPTHLINVIAIEQVQVGMAISHLQHNVPIPLV